MDNVILAGVEIKCSECNGTIKQRLGGGWIDCRCGNVATDGYYYRVKTRLAKESKNDS